LSERQIFSYFRCHEVKRNSALDTVVGYDVA
jgi:hypothetical protein